MKIPTCAVAMGLMAVALSAAPASAQSRSSAYQAYVIVDFNTMAPKRTLMDAAETALDRYTTQLDTVRPIGIRTPEEPGRFELTNPLSDPRLGSLGPLAALAGARSQSFVTATCEGAVWTASLQRQISGSQNLKATLCLFPYKNDTAEGYHLNVYMSDVHDQGGNISQRLGRAMVGRLIGTPEDFTKRMIIDTVTAIETAADTRAVLVESDPDDFGLATR